MGMNVLKVEAKDTTYGPIKEVQVNDGKQIVTATIWRKQKDGSEFPGFEEIAVGSVIEGNLWQKPGTDKWSIFPAKPKSGFGGGMGAGLIKAKNEGIKEAQKNKEEGIRTASIFRAAYETTLAQLTGKTFSESEFSAKFTFWKSYFEKNFNGSVPASQVYVSPEMEEIDLDNMPF